MSVVVPTVLSEGQAIDPTWEVLSLEIDKEVNRLPDARLVLLDGSAASGRFPISDAAAFAPGKPVEIKLRYEGEEDVTVFEGVVTRHRIESGGVRSVLNIELKDVAIKLTHKRKSAVFRDQSDDQVVDQLVRDAGLEVGTLESTEPTHVELVQYYVSDWDFILSRADVQGLVVVVDDGVVSLVKMAAEGSPSLSFEYGLSEIFELELEADASHQVAGMESVGWDIAGQALAEPTDAEPVEVATGNLDGAAVAEALGYEVYRLTHGAPLTPEELQAWANARLARSRLSLIRGRLVVGGIADIKPMHLVELAGMGARFNGTALVTGVRHRVDQDGWQTDLRLGLSPEWYCHRPDLVEVPATGLLPPVNGLQIGVVDAFEEDPDGEHRIKVALPSLGDEGGPVWARVSTPDAGAGRGYLFWPEPGDEVVVGFFDSDPRQPVVLGAMFSSVNTPPESVGAPSEENTKKGVVTKKGTTIGFLDADKASVFVETAGGNKVLIDDEAESIVISDQHGNSITMDKDGIVLKSAGDFKVDASGNVEIKGEAIDLK